MRQFLILIALFAGVITYSINPQLDDYSSIDPYVFEDEINSTIEGLRPDIPDPLVVELYEIDLPETEDAIITGNGTITNLNLAGLQSFQVTYLNFAIVGMRLNLTLDLPKIDFFTDYSLNLLVGNTVPVFGDGNLTIHIEDLEIQATAQANLTGGISVQNLELQITIGNATFDLHGLFNDEELSDLISSILNDLAVNLIDENQELITQIISPIAESLINSILATLLATTTVPPDLKTKEIPTND
jgi:hypothetical protein